MPTDKFHDERPQGQMGIGSTNAPIKTDLASNGKKLSENCEGWDSKSFKLPLSKGADPSYCYDDQVESDGPAWPSNSKTK